MYSVKIRGHMMIAHSLPSEAFGPAQNMHGATYVVDATFKSKKVDKNNIVIDIDLATKQLNAVLAKLNYQNLDELEIFNGKLTTTEFLANYIHGEIASAVKGKFKGKLCITLGESHVAWAAYEGKV